MSDALQLLEEDRRMRDAARKLIESDIRNLRGDVDEQGVGSRMALRLREGAEGVGDDLAAFAKANPAQVGTALAVGTALTFAWLFRDRIADAVEKLWQEQPPAPDPTIPERIAAKVRSLTD
jgi:hypothetical protein